MTSTHLTRRLAATIATAALCAVTVAACGSSRGLQTGTRAASSGSSAMRTTSGSAMGAMAGDNPAHTSAKVMRIDGITPIPTQILSTSDWQDMKIQAMAMTAVPFVVFNGTREETERMPRHVSFHLMVTLQDARSHEPIPYASVWATIRRNGKVVYDARQWPMIAEYLGPHYGNNVALPGAGHYQLSLLVSPPVSARHVEYENVWLKPHRVTASFNWTPPKS